MKNDQSRLDPCDKAYRLLVELESVCIAVAQLKRTRAPELSRGEKLLNEGSILIASLTKEGVRDPLREIQYDFLRENFKNKMLFASEPPQAFFGSVRSARVRQRYPLEDFSYHGVVVSMPSGERKGWSSLSPRGNNLLQFSRSITAGGTIVAAALVYVPLNGVYSEEPKKVDWQAFTPQALVQALRSGALQTLKSYHLDFRRDRRREPRQVVSEEQSSCDSRLSR